MLELYLLSIGTGSVGGSISRQNSVYREDRQSQTSSNVGGWDDEVHKPPLDRAGDNLFGIVQYLSGLSI